MLVLNHVYLVNHLPEQNNLVSSVHMCPLLCTASTVDVVYERTVGKHDGACGERDS